MLPLRKPRRLLLPSCTKRIFHKAFRLSQPLGSAKIAVALQSDQNTACGILTEFVFDFSSRSSGTRKKRPSRAGKASRQSTNPQPQVPPKTAPIALLRTRASNSIDHCQPEPSYQSRFHQEECQDFLAKFLENCPVTVLMRNFLDCSRYELKDIQHSLYKVLALYWHSGNVVKQEGVRGSKDFIQSPACLTLQ